MRPTTTHLKPGSHERAWHLVDAEGQVLGRLATRIAMILMGKHRPSYSPHLDAGDAVVIVNAEKIKVTGTKAEDKVYVYHTGYPGGRREVPYATMLERHPERILEKAVSRMMPKNNLGRERMKKLHIYAGPEHPHTAQKPQPLA